jgi:prevent-host-death family protein
MTRFSEDLRPMSDLKSGGADIVRQAQESGRPVVLTRHGRGVAVVLSVEAYDELAAASQLVGLRLAIGEADAAVAAGRVSSHDDVLGRINARMARDGV